MKSIFLRPLAGIAAASSLLFSSCSSLDSVITKAPAAVTKFQADVAKAETWAQSPTGQALLNDLVVGINAYVVSAGGGPKSTANAAAISAAVRSLQTGKAPDTQAVASAVENYIPGGVGKDVVNAIVASATAGPNVNGGLEVAAKAIDAATASKG